jgi:hypothetical protein
MDCKAAPISSIEAVEARSAFAPSRIMRELSSIPLRASAPTWVMPFIEALS